MVQSAGHELTLPLAGDELFISFLGLCGEGVARLSGEQAMAQDIWNEIGAVVTVRS